MNEQSLDRPYLSVVVPAFNEEKRIANTLLALKTYLDTRSYGYEVIVSDDGSSDQTVAVVTGLSREWPQLQVLTASSNQGKGAAVKRGVMKASGEWILFTDADNATPIEEIEKLLPHTADFPIVFGSRHIPGAHIHVAQARHRMVLSRLSNLLIRVLAVPGVYDTQCGFKLFKQTVAREIFSQVTLNRFGFDIEVLAIAKSYGYPAKEVGINWYNDFDSRVRAGREAIRTLTELLKIKKQLLTGHYKKVRSTGENHVLA